VVTVARDEARDIQRRPWFKLSARLGLVSRGVIYGLLAYFAIDIALRGSAPAQANGSGALADVAHQSGAPALLVILSAGMFAYGFWRLVQAIGGTSNAGAKSSAQRIGWLAISAVYFALFGQAISLILGSEGSGGGPTSQPSPFVGRVLRWPGGPELVGLAAVVVIGSGVALAVWACMRDFDQAFETWRMGRGSYFGARASQIFGDITRGVLIVLIGIYILVGAVTDDPNHVKSLGEVLKTIAHQAYGGWLLGIGASGLLAFSVSSMFEALYRRV
jgi:hypothetical protein